MKKIAIVTGANSGLGFETAKELYLNGYTVIFACRNLIYAKEAIKEIEEKRENKLYAMRLDLIDYDSILEFSKEFINRFTHLDLLVNNAGVMMPPKTITNNNLELQLDANYMGHFYLTYLLYGYLLVSESPKIITLSSLAHKRKEADIYYDDINFSLEYKPFTAYCQSKLACAIFGYQLSKNPKVKSIICHPGVSDTNLKRYFPKWAFVVRPLVVAIAPISKQEDGAKSVIDACLNDSYETGSYVGPLGFKEWQGKPGVASLNDKAMDETYGKKLWEFSEKHLNIKFDI